MMTFTEDLEFDREQRRRFVALADGLRGAGVPLGRLHAASTYTLFQHGAEASFDMVRPGMALLGIYPNPRFKALNKMDLKPAVAPRVRVAFVKRIAAGTSAGYDRAYVAANFSLARCSRAGSPGSPSAGADRSSARQRSLPWAPCPC